MSTTKKLVILGVVLFLVLGVIGTCAAMSSSNGPAQSPGIEVDIDHDKKKSKKSDKKAKTSKTSSAKKR